VDAAIGTRGTVERVRSHAAGERDDDAFAALFEAQHVGVLRLAYVMTGDVGVAEEVVADAFAAMYPRWRAGKVDDPNAYLRRAVVNQARGRFRRNATRRRFEASSTAADAALASDTGLAERDRVRSALLELPPGQRAVLALRFLEDRSEAETASLLGVSAGTVKSQAAHGLARLRDALEEKEDV
jgi:RNA polymerase sigma-70 factor (sigma-E family)